MPSAFFEAAFVSTWLERPKKAKTVADGRRQAIFRRANATVADLSDVGVTNIYVPVGSPVGIWAYWLFFSLCVLMFFDTTGALVSVDISDTNPRVS